MDSVQSNQMFSDFTTFSNHGSMGYDFQLTCGGQGGGSLDKER